MKSTHLMIFAFAALCTLACCGRSDGDRITDVLNACAEVAQKVGALNSAPSEQANFVADSFHRLDVSKCPTDFQMAFQAHALEWQFHALTFQTDLVGGSVDRVNQTYHELTQIAARYGARIPRSVVGE